MIHGGDMNERMKELAKQAGFGPTANPYERQAFDVNKFAELIVRECAGVCDDLRDSTDYEFEKDMADNCAQSIMKRFGVE